MPPAFATQATVAMLAQGVAQRAQQARTSLQQSMAIARTAARGSMGLVQDKLLEIPAYHVH